ncbi:TetR/AcrR family transcriptional regulator [Maritimibacter dapengensis]|uniref:TetR/AcrR family transcriptional regulator n=1 Tax=Maritimibacter dapengensis TaxID=2836868 RepID=A0ABS6SWL1_9RHOB|nr:TetR/AcrR family transcriptional regulator [Maritimibacter dapengensis]MBV7377309.1 TetR/AcrR family transcriptional regulator [Maritimibacter dapengensis]
MTTTLTKPRLKVENWIAAGFRALISHGPEALKAEPLARDLGTTKGSFYWHFKDVPDFRFKMLSHWLEHAMVALQSAIDAGGTPTERLYRLADATTAESDDFGGAAAEPAIRAWAQSDPMVAKAVEEIDRRRLAYVERVLKDLDFTNPDFARIIYGAYIGMGTLSATDGRDNKDALSTLMAAILALQDA